MRLQSFLILYKDLRYVNRKSTRYYKLGLCMLSKFVDGITKALPVLIQKIHTDNYYNI